MVNELKTIFSCFFFLSSLQFREGRHKNNYKQINHLPNPTDRCDTSKDMIWREDDFLRF